MPGHYTSKENFVLELDAGHVEQIFDALVHSQFLCKHCSVFIFDRVLTLQPAREIHRHEPAGNMTRQTERSADGPEDLLAHFSRLSIELFKPFAHPAAMVPFLGLDLFDLSSFRRFS